MWTGRQRLEALASYLETTDFAPGKFHMNTWMASYKELLDSLRRNDPIHDVVFRLRSKADMSAVFEADEDGITPVECKTAGCAVGWGVVGIPEFRKQGLRFVRLSSDSAMIEYRGRKDFEAAAAFFGIEIGMVAWLFGPGSYELNDRSNPKAVAARIRAHLNEV